MEGTAQRVEIEKCHDSVLCELLGFEYTDDITLTFPTPSSSEMAMLRRKGIDMAVPEHLYRFAVGISLRFVRRNTTSDELIE